MIYVVPGLASKSVKTLCPLLPCCAVLCFASSSGTYTLVVRGTGVVELSGDTPSVTLSTPVYHEFQIDSPSPTGLYVYIVSSSAADHIHSVQVGGSVMGQMGRVYVVQRPRQFPCPAATHT